MNSSIRFLLFIILFAVINTSCGQKNNTVQDNTKPEEHHEFTNKLIDESSPYLLQHAHNPVNWYPWGEEALEKAKSEKKLLLVSIGYAACHWCHVMEHESFEDSTVAALMNANFVCVKVDREERPDVDQVYMNAAQLMTGRGGWPLNAIALPDGRPIFAGTYFPKDQWISLLNKVQEFYINEPEKAEEQAANVVNGIKGSEMLSIVTENVEFTKSDLEEVFTNWHRHIDYTLGGKTGAPKFPMPIGYEYLLNHYFMTGDERAKEATMTTLDQMAYGGIYDQVGGGFARYSVDQYWKVPHFEKMLYDNGQLVSLYAHAYQVSKNPLYKRVVFETLEFVERELMSKENAFYASLDADSEGEEGKFYVWTKKELDDALGSDAALMGAYYNVTEKGNWEHGNNILLIKPTVSDTEFAETHDISVAELTKKIREAKETLLAVRAKRVRPALDDKVLTSWNALMLKGYVDAYRAFDEDDFLKKALENADFIQSKMLQKGGSLKRNYKNGKATINGFLDDYSLVIDAYISLYQATFDEKWIFEADKLLQYTLKHFYNVENGMFYYTSDMDDALIARKMEVADNVIPASNSVMGKNLYLLGEFLYKPDYVKKAKQMLKNVKENLPTGMSYYANWDILMSWFVTPPYEVAILGDDFEKVRKEFDRHYLPNAILMGGKTEGKLPLLESKLMDGQTTIFVCQNKTCRMPVTEVQEALNQIFGRKY